MRRFYLLDAVSKPYEVDETTWLAEFGSMNRVLAQDEIDGVLISTIFLGIDHRHVGDGPPLLYETMCFADDLVGKDQWRYSTHEKALEGHRAVVELVVALARKGHETLPRSQLRITTTHHQRLIDTTHSGPGLGGNALGAPMK